MEAAQEQGQEQQEQQSADSQQLEGLFNPESKQGSPGEQMVQQSGQQGVKDQQSQGQPGQGATPQWDGNQWVLTYRGQQVTPKSREELINLAQKGFSYSQEMAKLNQQRQQYEQSAGKFSQYEQFDKYLKANPHVGQAILSTLSQYQQQGAAQPQSGQQPAGYVPPELLDRINHIEQLTQKQQESVADSQLDNEVKQIRTKYPNHDWDADTGTGSLENQLLQFALDQGITNLDYAYRIMMWDSRATQAKADALKQQTNQRQQQFQQGVVQGGNQSPAPAQPGGYQYGMGYKDIAKKMASEMSG